MSVNGPIAGFYQNKSQGEVDQNGGDGEKNIEARVFDLAVVEFKQGPIAFYQPKE